MPEIAIVGGGPAGAMCGEQLARAGHQVQIFDEHLAWEKPCGGGLTHKAVECFPFLLDNSHPKKLVRSIDLISSDDNRVTLEMCSLMRRSWARPVSNSLTVKIPVPRKNTG